MPQPNHHARLIVLLLELLLIATALGVFAHGHANRLRTALWSTGGEHGWNCNPRLRIYFYANHQEPPPIPFLWTESLLWSGAFFYSVLMSGFWMFCVSAQASSDLTDPQHLSPRPWYLERSCAELSGQDGSVCRQGKAAFGTAVVCM
ncbi:hypothetical protein N658DRAFT_479468 [Parathielavia hyrcaniae]|uniref:Uncharacterized protein n=1 Tax=Parathielavia hyrcaniae TaxID=113614 RepID=A0AAN6PSU3_9PEZI|nr:hypothetical protein N658DRAFT_479468 [Parathielavia hyrcaniae]